MSGELKDHPYANSDYSRILGANIQDENDPFGGKIPSDPKDYGVFRKYYENKMMEVLGGQGIFKVTACCEDIGPNGQPLRRRGPKPEHMGANMCFGCDHAIHQDPVNPEGIYFVPLERGSLQGYWLCSICFRSLKRHRLDLNDIHVKCSACVLETVMRVFEQHPDRVINLNDPLHRETA